MSVLVCVGGVGGVGVGFLVSVLFVRSSVRPCVCMCVRLDRKLLFCGSSRETDHHRALIFFYTRAPVRTRTT